MKKLKNILTIIIISTIIISIFLYSSLSNREKIKLDVNRSINTSMNIYDKIDLKNDYDLMKVFNDTIYFVSWNNKNKGKLYFLNKKNKKIESYLSTKNDVIIGNYYKNNLNNITLLDTSQRKILTVNNTGKIINENHLQTPIARGIMLNDDLFFTTWNNDLILKFFKLKTNNQELSEIKNNIFSELEKHTGIIYDGILKQADNKIVLVPYSANEVLFFNSNFEFEKKLKLIPQKQDFKLLKIKNGETIADPNNLYPNIYSDIHNGKLYILSNSSGRWNIKDTYYIDVYNIKNSNYEYSYIIDDSSIIPREILVNDNKIFVLGKNKLNVYEIK